MGPSRTRLLTVFFRGLGSALALFLTTAADGDSPERRFVKTKTIDGERYRSEKMLGDDFESSAVFDSTGRATTAPKTVRLGKQISDELLRRISDLHPEERIRVVLAVESLSAGFGEQSTFGRARRFEDRPSEVAIEGKPIDLDRFRQQRLLRSQEVESSVHSRLDQLPTLAADGAAPSQGLLVARLTRDEILSLLGEERNGVLGIESFVQPVNDMRSAVVETGIDPWALFPWRGQGEGTRVYMAEGGGCIDDELHYLSNYLDIQSTTTSLSLGEHSIKTTGVLRAASPKAFIHCAGGGFSLPVVGTMLPYTPYFRPSPNPPGSYDVVSVSMSQGLFGTYSVWDREWDNFVYTFDVPIFQSAGNLGRADEFVSSPGTAFNVITVGNYDHQSGDGTINLGSGWKDGETGINKPEIVAPGTDLDIRGIDPIWITGSSGTSYSTPHAAGFYLNFISDEPWFSGSAALAKAYMIAHASIDVDGGVDRVGEGGIDYRKAGGNIYWWNEPNSKWSDMTNEGNYLTLPVAINWQRDKATVAIAWLTRGDYTYAHRTDVHPIGLDFDMRVIDAEGNYICGSASWDNTYESCTWTLPSRSTSYRVRVNRYANRDSLARIKLAIVSHSFDVE